MTQVRSNQSHYTTTLDDICNVLRLQCIELNSTGNMNIQHILRHALCLFTKAWMCSDVLWAFLCWHIGAILARCFPDITSDLHGYKQELKPTFAGRVVAFYVKNHFSSLALFWRPLYLG